MSERRAKRIWPANLLAALLCLPCGTAFHELVGHGLTGVLAGGRLTFADILFVQVLPRVELHGWRGYYGACEVENIPSVRGQHLMLLGGSLSTLLAATGALALLWMWRPRRGFARAALLAIGIWWVDLLTYTLPTWGLRRSIFWGGRVAEPCDAAVALGMPRHLFQACVILISLTAAGVWIHCARDPRKPIPSPADAKT